MINIYGTLGPGCADAATLEKMFENGMTGVRLNLAHSTLPDSKEWLRELNIAAKHLHIKPDLLIDMQGPEIRVGYIASPLVMEEGEEVCICASRKAAGGISGSQAEDTAVKGNPEPADISGIPVPEMIFPYLKPGQQLLLDDGKLLLEVTEREQKGGCDEVVRAKVIRGGRLSGGKSIALPGTDIYPPTMTENDRMHIRMAKEYGVTGIMQPFVRDRQDLETVRQALDEAGCPDVRVFAKIENMDGVRHLAELMPAADEFVIARGDLGNSMPLWQLPAVQKQIAAQCRAAGKPFMVVTQMLASMENVAVPTRAEVSDIFNAVLDGASSVMVTGETAVGRYPAEAIRYLANTARAAKEYMAAVSRKG